MRIRFILLLISIFSLIYVGYTQITAQNSSTCPGMIHGALDDIGNNCGGLDRNSACYGYESVMATFTDVQPADFFASPADRAGLVELEGITTAPLDQALNQWGVALLSVQANLPDTLPGQSVVFMIVGGTQIENAVPPDQAFQTAGTASVTLTIGADLYFETDMTSQIVGNVPMGTSLTADAVSADGQWVRVVYQGTPGWVTRQVIDTETDLSALATMGPDTKTPMQAFYFRTGITGTECADAPTSLIVQGPQNLMVDITANGAEIQLGSTIALIALDVDPMTLSYLQDLYSDDIGSVGKLLKIIVLDGHVILNPGTDDEVELETGETTFRCLSEPENLGVDGEANDRTVIDACPWAPERAVTVEELEEFRDIEGFSLNYVIELPLDLPTLTPTPTNTPRPAGIFISSSTPVPTATFTPLPTDVPPQQQPPPPPTSIPTATFTPTPVCDGYVFPANIAAGDVAGLIDAINHANDEICHPGTDTINLGGGNYLFDSVNNTTDAPNVLPVITSGIVINGNGATFDLNDFGARYFVVNASLTLTGLTLQGGSAGAANGGNIISSGSLALSGVTLSNGSAENGGNVYNAGTMSVFSSSLENGFAGTFGGNLYNTGTASFNRSALVYGNGDNGGGGIYNTGSLDAINTTFGQNYANGGGWALDNAGGSAVLNFVTLIENLGDGGFALNVSGGGVTVHNSIIASSFGSGCLASGGTLTGNATSFNDDGSCAAYGFTTDATMYFGPLSGYPPSQQIYPPSAAVDAAACTTNSGATVGEDQIGFPRPFAVTPDVVSDCDSGAREWDGSSPPG